MSATALQSNKSEESDSRFFALLERVVTSPDIPVEKVRALWEMQKEIEAQRAKEAFDADMIEAQKEVQALKWDKINTTNNSRNVSYPKIDKMLRPVREKYGFTQTFKAESPEKHGFPSTPNTMIMVCYVLHRDGHREPYPLPMPIDGAGPKGGGVMTGPQAVGNGTSYGMRYLAKMIWDIPMLVDKDDNDGNAPYETITKQQVEALNKLAKDTKSDIKKFCEYYKVDSIENLPKSSYDSAVAAFNKKQNAAKTISEKQAADLKALAEETRSDIKKFCEEHGIKSVEDLPASAYASAIKTLEEKRRAS